MSRERLLVRLRPWCHGLLLTIPLLMYASAQAMHYLPAAMAAAIPLVVMFVLLPVFDTLIGHESINLPAKHFTWIERRLLPLLCLPCQAGMLWWGIPYGIALPWAASLLWFLSMGVIGGIVAINVAHELIHRRSRLDRCAGGLLLSLVNYAGFKVEHLRSHHIYVATPKDASTARLNQSAYHFILVSLWQNPRRAWRLESTRLQRQGLSAWHWRNELLWWHGISLALALLAVSLWGGYGLLAYLAQGVLAAATLEVINYVEHYGLMRQKIDGRYEPPNEHHSWNSDYFLSNAILLQLQRHADHHAHPLRDFPYLRHRETAPQLPLGYAAMFVLALLPPLWKRVMNPRVQEYAVNLHSSVDKTALEVNNAPPSRP